MRRQSKFINACALFLKSAFKNSYVDRQMNCICLSLILEIPRASLSEGLGRAWLQRTSKLNIDVMLCVLRNNITAVADGRMKSNRLSFHTPQSMYLRNFALSERRLSTTHLTSCQTIRCLLLARMFDKLAAHCASGIPLVFHSVFPMGYVAFLSCRRHGC
jgi:hypothetical protein